MSDPLEQLAAEQAATAKDREEYPWYPPGATAEEIMGLIPKVRERRTEAHAAWLEIVRRDARIVIPADAKNDIKPIVEFRDDGHPDKVTTVGPPSHGGHSAPTEWVGLTAEEIAMSEMAWHLVHWEGPPP